LSEVADNLPELTEEVVSVGMDDELAECYADVEEPLMAAIKEMLVRGDKRLLGTMLQVLLAYPDYPFEWGPVGYQESWQAKRLGTKNSETFVTVCIPRNLDASIIRPKEAELLNLVRNEANVGRQVWVYVQYTDKRDVQERLRGLLEKDGLRVGSLRASVSLAKREEWINKNAPGLDVVISHPRLVETGLDLFSKRKGGHNFATLIFYETGYNLFTLRQSSRRSWRIGQKLPCKVVYLYYGGTLQERCMSLMGKKLTEAQALEGKFSSEGLAAMAGGDGGSVEMALARSLADRLDEGDAQRARERIASIAPEPVILSLPNARQRVIRRVLDFDFRALRTKLAR
jgi:SNF2 family DNA or RNA helicase